MEDFPVLTMNDTGSSLYVKGFPCGVTEDDVRDVFTEFGIILGVRVIHRQNYHLAAALVHFVRSESAERALCEMDNYVYRDKVLHVEWAENRYGGNGVGRRNTGTTPGWQCADPGCYYINPREKTSCGRCGLSRTFGGRSMGRGRGQRDRMRVFEPDPEYDPYLLKEKANDEAHVKKLESEVTKLKKKVTELTKELLVLQGINMEEQLREIYQIQDALAKKKERRPSSGMRTPLVQQVADVIKEVVGSSDREHKELLERFDRSYDFYETCLNMYTTCDSSLRDPMQTSLDGALQALAVNVKEFLRKTDVDVIKGCLDKLEEFAKDIETAEPKVVESAKENGDLDIDDFEAKFGPLNIDETDPFDHRFSEATRRALDEFVSALDLIKSHLTDKESIGAWKSVPEINDLTFQLKSNLAKEKAALKKPRSTKDETRQQMYDLYSFIGGTRNHVEARRKAFLRVYETGVKLQKTHGMKVYEESDFKEKLNILEGKNDDLKNVGPADTGKAEVECDDNKGKTLDEKTAQTENEMNSAEENLKNFLEASNNIAYESYEVEDLIQAIVDEIIDSMMLEVMPKQPAIAQTCP